VLDILEGLPKVTGKYVILTMVNHFSKSAHFIALGHPYSATTITMVFFDSIVHLHGVSASIASNRDPVFTSTVWKELFRLIGTKLCTNLAFHLQTDGQSELTNKIIIVYLRCFAGDKPRTWLQWLP
jgi:hypothetical protein